MNEHPVPADTAEAKAAAELAQLELQVEAARAVLIRLLQDVVEAEARLGSSQAAQLVEANAQLVVTALRAQTDAVTTALALDDMTQSAERDPLTQLPNRLLLLDRFAHAIANAKRHGTRLALLFLDLDNFKQVNDTLGHSVGDQVLKDVAQCLAASVRAGDTVSRHGGDEFVILLTEVSQPSDVAAIADKVVAAIASLGPVGGQELPMTTSVGIALYPDDGEDAATLIDHADSAMYHAKTHRLGSFFFQRMVPARERSLETQARVSRRRSAADYERALAEQERRNAQLSEANEQLVLTSLGAQALQAAAEQAQRRQTKFMAVVARELRDPLAPIRIATAMLGLPRTDELLLPRAQALIERQLANLSRLVGELVDGSRTETGALILERKSVDMAGLIGETVDACRPALNARQQRIDVDLPAGPLEVQGDRARLAQVLGNLLDNASKYTPDGGAIGLSVAVTGKALAVTVSDNGIGIVAQALPHIFEPFVQDARASGLHGTGLGLGLTVVRELVEAHGGTVTARSAGSGLGSQFVVTLPLA